VDRFLTTAVKVPGLQILYSRGLVTFVKELAKWAFTTVSNPLPGLEPEKRPRDTNCLKVGELEL
jgi:hypothetical protein